MEEAIVPSRTLIVESEMEERSSVIKEVCGLLLNDAMFKDFVGSIDKLCKDRDDHRTYFLQGNRAGYFYPLIDSNNRYVFVHWFHGMKATEVYDNTKQALCELLKKGDFRE